MKTRWMIVPLGLAMLLAVKGFSAAEKDGAKKEFKATCPVSGKPAIETSFIELPKGDGKLYFCCEKCPAAYEKDPKKFRLQMHQQLLETGQIAQVACPISGHAVNKEDTVDAGFAKVSFCCEKCLAKYNAAKDDAAKQKMLFDAKAMKAGYTHQVNCPISGKPIDPAQSVEYKGEKVYFCCEHCPEAFNKDPEKYVGKLYQFTHASKKEDKAKK